MGRAGATAVVARFRTLRDIGLPPTSARQRERAFNSDMDMRVCLALSRRRGRRLGIGRRAGRMAYLAFGSEDVHYVPETRFSDSWRG